MNNNLIRKKPLWIAGTAIVLAVLLIAGFSSCSAGVAGHPQPGMTPVDINKLKTGSFTTQPTTFKPRLVGTTEFRRIESRRMLGYLIHSFDVDPDITDWGPVKLITSSADLVSPDGIPSQYQPVGDKYQVLAGVYASRTNGDLRGRKKLIVSILRFPTEADSHGAAEEFDRITNSEPGRHPIDIEGYPDARTRSSNDALSISTIARGPYMVLINVGIPKPDKSALANVVKKTIDLQFAKLDKLQPTPLDDILDLPTDPDGIMRRAAPVSKDALESTDQTDVGPLDPDAELHYQRNPIEVKKAFEEGGVDLVGRRGGIVYRTRDLAAAFRLQSALSLAGKDDDILEPPPGLPDAKCLKYDSRDPNRSYNAQCVIVYGRYVAVVSDTIPAGKLIQTSLYERAAAQYAILEKAER
ncbi:DUF7373 family lipoprotein [Nocardia transvalensis]|uniref:DUF7373 family lipoprotein n=1 Tax=Nocardia transvalensis TaxID=37333 RepID=UPI0018947158|nr:hypothetical protein [Nocardia transvalensis]MBF6327473.1 hypothetical protein [Nocardia transvalensis]